MGRFLTKKSSVQSHCAFCDIEAESLLLFLAGFVMYAALAQLYSFLPFDCGYILTPQIVLIFLYIIASVVLFFGVVCSVRGLIKAFVWIMVLCLITNVVFALCIYFDQRCLCNNFRWLNRNYYLEVIAAYSMIGFFAGINFVIGLLFVLIVSNYLRANPYLS